MDLGSRLPPEMIPEFERVVIIGEDHQMTLIDADVDKGAKTSIRKATSNTLSAILRMNSKVVEITAPAIGAAQHGTDDRAVGHGDKTHSGVLFEIRGHWRKRVDVADDNSWRGAPKIDNCRVIVWLEFAYLDWHGRVLTAY